MKTADFNSTRQELINWIGNLNDSTVINLLNSIRMSFKGVDKDWWDELTEHDKNNIKAGLKDMNDGRTMNSKDFWNSLNNE